MTTLTSQARWPVADPSKVRSRSQTALLWIAQIAAAAMFLLSGALKFGGAAPMVQLFGAIGIGQWFRFLTGAIEVAGAVLLLVPSLAFLGAAALAVTMVGAIFAHLVIVGGNPMPAVILLVTTTAIAWARRSARVRF
jgi:putative oxidoreductase